MQKYSTKYWQNEFKNTSETPIIYGSNTRAFSYVKEALLKLKSHIKPHILIVGYINTPLSPLDRCVQQKLNSEINELTVVMTQMDLKTSIEHSIQT